MTRGAVLQLHLHSMDKKHDTAMQAGLAALIGTAGSWLYLQLLINDLGNVSESGIAAFRQAQAQPAGPGKTLLLGIAAYRYADCTHNSFAENIQQPHRAPTTPLQGLPRDCPEQGRVAQELVALLGRHQ